jgi:PAS domain S-box-containing protein
MGIAVRKRRGFEPMTGDAGGLPARDPFSWTGAYTLLAGSAMHGVTAPAPSGTRSGRANGVSPVALSNGGGSPLAPAGMPPVLPGVVRSAGRRIACALRGAVEWGHRWSPRFREAFDLRRGVGWLERVLGGLEEGIIVADAAGHLRPANPAAVRILGTRVTTDPAAGWEPEASLWNADGRTPLPPERHPLCRALRGEDVEGEEHLLRNESDGEGRWVGVSARPLRDPTGRVVGALLAVRDLTDRRRSEADLHRLSSAVAQTTDAVLIADRSGRVVYVNPSFEALTGVPRDEALALAPHAMLQSLHDPGVYDTIRATTLIGLPFRDTVVHRPRGGNAYPADETVTPVKDASGAITHVVVVARDASERRRLEEKEFSLRLAGQLQQRLYPARPPCVAGLDVAGSVVAAEETCGDCFDYLEAPDGALAIAVGDVSGHGLGPALIMAQARAYLRAVAGSRSAPWDVLRTLNGHLCRDLPDDRFVTLLLVAVDPRTCRLTWASAGHVAGLLVDREGALKARLPASGPPLGIFPDEPYPATEPLTVEPGDALILVTDGVTECRSPLGEEFDERGILDVARANATASAAVMLDALHDRLRGFSAGAPPRDDVTVVVCRVGGDLGARAPADPAAPNTPYAPESARQPVSSTRGVQ